MKVFVKMLQILTFVVVIFVATVSSSRSTVESKPKPSFVIVITDDQDVVLNGLLPMKKTQELLSQQGVTFTNAVNLDNLLLLFILI